MSARLRPILLLVGFVAVMSSPPWMLTALMALAAAVTSARLLRAVVGFRRSSRHEQGALALATDRTGRGVSIAPGELAAHGLILGASGAGKTTTLLRILTEQIMAGKPVIGIDMKGSPAFADALARASAAAGRPFKLWTIEGAAHWNPLQYGNPTELKDKLIATERFSEPHYQRAAERCLQIVLRVTALAHPHQPATLEEMVALMDPRRLPIVLRRLPIELSASVQDYLSALTHDQLSAIRGMQTRLALITESQAGPYLRPGREPGQAIDLRRAMEGPEVVLFSLNSGSYGKLASQLGTLAVQDLVSALGRRLSEQSAGSRLAAGGEGLEARADGRLAPGGEAPRAGAAATIAIDEFSGLGGDHIVSLLARVREAGGGVLLATQEMADLDRAAAGVRDQVVGNTAFKIVHRQDVPASARLVAQMGGTERIWEETRQFGAGAFGLLAPRGASRRQADRFILDPNEIMNLRTGEAALISKLGAERPQIVRVSRPQDRRGAAVREDRRGAPAREERRGAPARGRRDYPPPGVTR